MTDQIKMLMVAVDGHRSQCYYKTIDGAAGFANKWLGSHYDLGAGGFYALSGDGINKVWATGEGRFASVNMTTITDAIRRHDPIVEIDVSEMEKNFRQECAAEEEERALVEKKLRKIAEKAGLDFWYIGNIESWGDDRQLRFGKDGDVVYECSAASLTTADVQWFENTITSRR